jgi:hypothetical protein
MWAKAMTSDDDSAGPETLVGKVWTVGGGALWIVLGYAFAQLAAAHAWALMLLALIAVPAGTQLIWTRLSVRGRAELDMALAERWPTALGFYLTLLAACTTGFSSVSVLLTRFGIGHLSGAAVGRHEVVAATYESYLWHLADAIPVLKIPETTNWVLHRRFTDPIQGGLLLAYTVLVILPLIYAGTKLLRRWTDDPPDNSDLETQGVTSSD